MIEPVRDPKCSSCGGHLNPKWDYTNLWRCSKCGREEDPQVKKVVDTKWK